MNMNMEERSRLDVIEAKVDRLLTYHEYEAKTRDDHEQRIRSVERWKLSIPVSVLLALATFVGVLMKGV